MRKKSILGIFIAILAIGAASGALLDQYVSVTGESHVQQSVVFEDNTVSKSFSFDGGTMSAGTYVDAFTIKNRAETQEVVRLNTTQFSDLDGDGNWDEGPNVEGVNTDYIYTVNSSDEYESGTWHYDALITTAGPKQLENLGGISFEGKSVKSDESDYKSPLWFEIQLDRDGVEPTKSFAEVEGNYAYAEGMDAQAVGSLEKLNNDSWQTRNLNTMSDDWDLYLPDGTTCGPNSVDAGEVVGTDVPYCNYASLSDIQTDYPSTVLAKLIEVDSNETVKIKDYTVNGVSAEEGLFLGTTGCNEGHLDFEIINDFDVALEPGTYNVTTEVVPQ
ncbi:MAG: hypothetical protein R6U44_08065 [Archaeoglobaceae archaeon]